jgi:DNA-directed RNA polymerase subunit RPC12/RpoP
MFLFHRKTTVTITSPVIETGYQNGVSKEVILHCLHCGRNPRMIVARTAETRDYSCPYCLTRSFE